MNTKVKQIKVVPILIAMMVVSAAFIFHADKNIYSDSLPIKVDLSEMKFGDVYPGQEASKTFTVEYDGNSGSGEYSITKIHKAKHGVTVPAGYKGSVSSYCQTAAGMVDETRCYRYLCPFITVTSSEGEGDTMNKASVTKTDAVDTWTVYLKTPALYGKVTQDYSGDLVSESGEYGCDLSFDVGLPPAPVCGNSTLQEGEECDDGNILNGDGCSSTCKTEYSTISGYKYNDEDADGVWDCGEDTISGVEIRLITCPWAPLSDGAMLFNDKKSISTDPSKTLPGQCSVKATTTTDINGHYEFIKLPAGDYGVSEEDLTDWVQTYPKSGKYYYFHLSSGVDKTKINFLNHYEKPIKEPVCGDGVKEGTEECDDGNQVSGDGCSKTCKKDLGSISGCKYEDKDADGVIDDSEGKISGFKIWIINCQSKDGSACSKESALKTVDLDSNGCYSFDNLKAGTYYLGEVGSADWRQTYPAASQDYLHAIELKAGEVETGVNFLNTKVVYHGPVCGNSKVETNEECDDGNVLSGDGCSSSCKKESTSCSGCGGVIIPPRISDEKVVEIGCTSAKITWTTNKKTDSRVICSEKSIEKSNLGSKPDYGYAFSTNTYDTDKKVTGHGISLFDLKENTSYYCRAISTSGSRTVISDEIAFKTSVCKIIEPPVVVDTLYIYDLKLKSISKTCATLTWLTNINSTTCVVSGGSSKALGIKPTYGYEWSTKSCSSATQQTKTHSETLCGLNPCTTYYFRLAAANGTLDAVTDEQQMKTLCQDTSTYYPRTYVPSVAVSEPEEEGEVKAAETETCPECKVCQDTVKTVIEKQKYMSCEDWLILLLILVTLILLVNALRQRNRRKEEEETGEGRALMGGGILGRTIKQDDTGKKTDIIEEEKIELD